MFKSNKLLPTESLDKLLNDVLETNEWDKAQKDFNKSKIIFIVGNGGNLAVADHGSVDITRLSDKLAICPGSGILATSVIGDSCIDRWFYNWLNAHIKAISKEELTNCMVIGVSSSGTAGNIVSCLNLASENQMKTLMISSRYLKTISKNFNTIQLGTDFYHTGEVLSLMLFYQLIHGSGKECPSISKKINEPSFDRLVGTKK